MDNTDFTHSKQVYINPNYTYEMYYGNAPCGKGNKTIDAETGEFIEPDRWEFNHGNGETICGVIHFGYMGLGNNTYMHIIGDTLKVYRFKSSDKQGGVSYEYCNKGTDCLGQGNLYLKSNEVEKIINGKIDYCKFGKLMQKRARELFVDHEKMETKKQLEGLLSSSGINEAEKQRLTSYLQELCNEFGVK